MAGTTTDARRLTRRGAALRALRETLWARGFIEADTPQLVPGPGLEPHIDPLAVPVRLSLARGDVASTRYLITSPELGLKRVVAAGVPRVFQLGHVFRDGERTARHTPEFALLEWYRGPGTLGEIVDDTVALARAVADAVGADGPARALIDAPLARVTVAGAFAAAGVDLDAALTEADAGDGEALARRACAAGVHLVGADHTFDDAFFAVMDQRVEPALPRGRLVVLERWPARMAVLARRCDDDARYAARLEMYAHGAAGCVELCNAFDELRDPIEQLARFHADNAERVRLGKAALPLDDDFLRALPWLPAPTAGNALGVDRLLMLASGARAIDDVQALPFR